MNQSEITRKQRFQAAIALAGMTQADWAKSRGRTLTHLSQVLHGRRDSRVLNAEIDAFILEMLGKNKRTAQHSEHAA